MADIKILLKEAKKFIDEKKYTEAQESCKNILRKDKQNYFGLVLLGKALQDSDQAPLAFQKAIANNSENPLAWFGLANFYEKKESDNDKIKLFPIYEQILNIQIEDEKAKEIVTKLGYLGNTLKSHECLNIFVKYINKNKDTSAAIEAKMKLLQLLEANVPLKNIDISSVVIILNDIYNTQPSESLEVLYGKIILQKYDFVQAVDEIMQLNFFSENAILRDYLCEQICLKYTEKMSFNGLKIEEKIDVITNGITNSKYPGLLRSMILYDKELYLDAYKHCIPLINYHEADVIDVNFIINCTIKLKKWSVTQKLATNFLSKAKENIAMQLKRYLFVALVKQNKWVQAISLAKDIPADSLNTLEQVSLAECLIELDEPVDHIIENLEQLEPEYSNYLKALSLFKQKKYEEVVTLLQSSENALDIFYLGKAYWELEMYDQCHLSLLKAAKLDADSSDAFLYLGHFYYYHKNDLGKAKKCYEKSFSLNCNDAILAKTLSDVYVKLHQTETDFKHLIALSEGNLVSESWISFRLGLHYLKRHEWENAIINFRNVIKRNHNDVTAFECLASAYYSRGSYTSALKAYNKVLSMDPSKASHCLTKIGYIYSLLTQYDEAINTFEKVLETEPLSCLALKGISETWMRLAKKKVAGKIYGSARDCAQYAIKYIIRALQNDKHFLCLWKLLADTLMFITQLPNQYTYVNMPQVSLDPDSDLVKKDKSAILQQAIAIYSYIAKRKQKIATYELAYAYFSYYQETNKKEDYQISYSLTLSCIKENPSDWHNWYLLGKICLIMKKYEQAQHCFIKALMVTRKWSSAKVWCNLGTLYLKIDKYKLSNYCFWRGQSILPSYPQSWIGQALIAEEIRNEEAMDLFRHACRLGYHPESALGYADWVCRTLNVSKNTDDAESKYIIEGLYAIPYAMDLLEWFCCFEPQNACALNILGILQECSGLFRASLKSYEKAFHYAEDDKKNIILLNMGRLMIKMEQYKEALMIYKAINQACLPSTIGLALALSKNGLYEEAYSVYDTALNWLCDDDTEKAEILIAMAGVAYNNKGPDEAKTLLFQSIQTSQKSSLPYCLIAICSLGFINSDQSLIRLAVNELKKFEQDSKFSFDIGFLKSFSYASDANIEQAIKALSDSLQDYPSNALLWFCMAQYCLQASNKVNIARHCAQRALCSAQFENRDSILPNILATVSIAEHIAGEKTNALISAKRGLHMFPNHAEVWSALLLSLLSNKLWTERKVWLTGVVGHLRRNLNISRPLCRWVNLIEKRLSR